MQKEVDDVHDFYPIVKTWEICKFLTIPSTKLVKYASFVDTVSAASPISIVLQLVYLFRAHQAEGKWPKTARVVRHLPRTDSLVFFIVRPCGSSVGLQAKSNMLSS